MFTRFVVPALMLLLGSTTSGRQAGSPDWARLEEETMRHFQALVRFDTSDPPGNEKPAADYLRQVLEKEGIAVQTFALEPNRPNVVARLKGNGSKRPLLLMGHTDVVNVDAAKWTHPPFSATRADGYVYGRGTLDDKDNVVAVADGDADAQAAERAARSRRDLSRRVGRRGLDPRRHPVHGEPALRRDRRRVLPRRNGSGRPRRRQGAIRHSPDDSRRFRAPVELTARGISGHGSVPLLSRIRSCGSAQRLSDGGDWHSTIRLNETTRAYFTRLAEISSGAEAQRYRDVLDPQKVLAVDRYFHANDPAKAALLHATASPTMIGGGYR